MHHCFHCGREITDPSKGFQIIIVEGHSGRLGSAHLHNDCSNPSLSRYRQVIEWAGTIGSLARLTELHRRIARENGSTFGSVPLLLT